MGPVPVLVQGSEAGDQDPETVDEDPCKTGAGF